MNTTINAFDIRLNTFHCPHFKGINKFRNFFSTETGRLSLRQVLSYIIL